MLGSNNLMNWWDITLPFMYCVFHHISDHLQRLILFWQFYKKVGLWSDPPPPWLVQKTKFVKGKIFGAPLREGFWEKKKSEKGGTFPKLNPCILIEMVINEIVPLDPYSNAWWGGWVWHMDWGPPLSSFARRTLKQETGVCFIWHPEYLNRNIEIPNVSRWVKLRGSLVQAKYHIPFIRFDISFKSTEHLKQLSEYCSCRIQFCQVFALAYLCATYLCICVPVNSQFKYLSNIPSQYRATCQTLSIRNRHKLGAFFANSRSPTYDKEARSQEGWVFCENTAGKQFCHPAQIC